MIILPVFAALSSLSEASASTGPLPGARPCSAAERAALLAPVREGEAARSLTCSLTLAPDERLPGRIALIGAESSGVTLDCAGGSIGPPGQKVLASAPTVAIAARRDGAGWSRPTDITIRNCVIHGAVRLWGLGINQAGALKTSSRTPDHTARAQAAAPTRIRLERVTLIANGAVPLYVGPGVTDLALSDSRVRGRTVSVAVYLDAESADNRIIGNDFAIRTGRELVAVDGSARNRIEGNRFDLGGGGGVFLYRNCGEDGVVRHQTPSDNVISDNRFDLRTWVWPWTRLKPRAVVVGSREGRRRYCGDDAGWAFGSSADDGDNAVGNSVARNRVAQ